MKARPLNWRFFVAAFFLIIVLMHLCSCAPKRAVCERNYGPCGQAHIERITERIDTTVYLPGATVRDTLHLRDTLLQTRLVRDSSGRAALRWYRDAYGRLVAECQALPDTVRVYRELVREVQVPPEPISAPKNIWGYLVLGVVFLAVIFWMFAKY